MAFMLPIYYFGKMWVCDGCSFPWNEFTREEAEALCAGSVELSDKGWWVRLSAPGYMDQTDWDGPYEYEWEARKAVVYEHDRHPDTGEHLPDDVDNAALDAAIASEPLTDEDGEA